MAVVGKPFRTWILTGAGAGLAWIFRAGGTKLRILFGAIFGACTGATGCCIGAGGTTMGRPIALLDKVGIRIMGGAGVGRSTFLGMNCDIVSGTVGGCLVFI